MEIKNPFRDLALAFSNINTYWEGVYLQNAVNNYINKSNDPNYNTTTFKWYKNPDNKIVLDKSDVEAFLKIKE